MTYGRLAQLVEHLLDVQEVTGSMGTAVALRVAFADFSAAPWQGFEKSECGPNNSSLFLPQAAVVVVAVQVLLSAVAVKEKLPYKTKKTAIKSCLSCGAVTQSKSEPFPVALDSSTFSKGMVCVPSL